MNGSRKRLALLLILLGLAVALLPFRFAVRRLAGRAAGDRSQRFTVAERVTQVGAVARERLVPRFRQSGVAYPPSQVILVGLKEEQILELWAADAPKQMHLVHRYPILGASGGSGPKLREGDFQVPEGVYRVELLNPNSRFHLSLRLDYPNAFDRARAAEEGRTELGGDIMIHGGTASIGCLAMGDPAIEELFILAADVGLARIEVLLCPVDLRITPAPAVRTPQPAWLPGLYR
jgi:murein L,D-transpeptidase YafK